jgi:hypothetical protein
MKTVNLEKKEIAKANQIISTYQKLEVNLTDIQNKLEELDIEKTKLLKELDKTRSEETKFFSNLSKKHGEGKLDLYTMAYITD